MKRRAPGPALLTAALLLASAGCATTTPFVDQISGLPNTGFSYSTGRGLQDFPAPLSTVAPAVLAAMDDLKMTDVQQTRDGAVVRVEAKTTDNRHVAVTLRFRQGTTQVGARIGRFGDEPLSRALLERIGVRAGTRDPEAIPDAPPTAPSRNPYFSRSAIPDSVMLRDFANAPYNDRVVP
jgi:Protein of unknown function (DUF3568)